MSKLLLVIGALVVGSLILPAAFSHQPAPEVEWRWSDEKAKLAYCIKQHMPDYVADPVREKKYGAELELCTKDGRRFVWLFEAGVKGNVFTRWKENLFVAHYSSLGGTGCEVVAIRLATGKELWKSEVEGIGGIGSRYKNRVNIETDGKKIIVYGNESGGRYVEHLDINTGKMLLNKKFEPLRK